MTTSTHTNDPVATEVIDAIRRRVRSGPRRTSAGFPLFRGVLAELTGWSTVDGFPNWEERAVTIVVWCPFCGRLHRHGWTLANDGRVVSHRGSHCNNDSPLLATGYHISTLRTCDPGYSAHIARPGTITVRRCPRPAHLEATA